MDSPREGPVTRKKIPFDHGGKPHDGCNCNHPHIESIKTTSMEDVSTRVLEKIKNI